jgi:hypothetical protein
MVNRIAASSLTDDDLTIENMDPLATARGDIIGVTATDGVSAFVSGGFTDVDGFCDPLGSTEEYVFEGNYWKSLPDVVNERGEIVLVELDDHLYAMGGERQIEGICEITGDTDPGQLTVGTDEVEVLDGGDWKVIASFPEHKFRFAAVAVEDTGLIYAFGGQTAYDNSCKCFKTTDDVAIFGAGVSSGVALSVSVVSVILGFMGMGLMM